MIPFSVLDLSPVIEGATPRDAFRNTLDLAQHAERWGYRRYWLAEHHNMPGIASAATSLVIGHVAGGTKTIRVGSGGIMLPNHSPLVIAEQFGTLESLYPGRIDLGIGRAPGTDQRTAHALRRHMDMSVDTFPQDVLELQALLGTPHPDQKVHAVPGEGLNVPLWILGSSLYGAQLAAMLGLPYAFASHFAPDAMDQALEVYRTRFEPSAQLDRPYAMIGVNVIAAATDAEARLLFTSLQQQFVRLRRGNPGKVPPPLADMAGFWSDAERLGVERSLSVSVVGSPETVRQGLADLIEKTGADELMITASLYDHRARLRSFELTAAARESLAREGEGAPAA
ncbi:MAG: LLM class flavin-dependent oxidoreductase [Dongiaceae bacterium]